MSAAEDLASGKGSKDENFPVASRLIAARHRQAIFAFYRFARTADDIADNPDLSADDKVRRLDRMGEILDGAPGEDAPAATAMRRSLGETGTTAQHCHDVLCAFRTGKQWLGRVEKDEDHATTGANLGGMLSRLREHVM